MSFTSLARRIAVCHAADLAAFVPWHAAGVVVGRVHRDRVPVLAGQPELAHGAAGLELPGDDFADRSARMAALVAALAAAGAVRQPLGELYPVTPLAGGEALLAVDRCAVPWFGVHARGVHLNGFVRTAAGLSLWVARRARDKRTFPGHLDNLVAGGQSLGFDARTTLRKECHEEAGLPAALADGAVAVGTLHYTQQLDHDLKVDALQLFDLELPASFTPVPVDGEVEAFELWPLPQVAASLAGPAIWKPNCALVAIHFLLRHDPATVGGPDECARLWALLQGA